MRRLAVIAACALATLVWPAACVQAGVHHARPYDFNHDGRQELVVGLPGFSEAGAPDSGAVAVLPGTKRGLDAGGTLMITRSSEGVPGVPYGDEKLGSSVASGDFDSDGFADLATIVSNPLSRSSVLLLLGSRQGLLNQRARLVSPRKGSIGAGAALVAGRLDDDRFADLAVGMYGFRAGPNRDGQAAIGLLLGGRDGLSAKRFRKVRAPAGLEAFGDVLALGDVDGDGRIDLAEGSAGWPFIDDGEYGAGHSTLCLGTARGPSRCRRIGGGEVGPTSLAIGDVIGDEHPDLVQGLPVPRLVDEDLDQRTPHGELRIWRSTAAGLASRPTVITQDTPGVPGLARRRDHFGASVAVVDLGRDGRDEIVAGVPGHRHAQGRVTVLAQTRGARWKGMTYEPSISGHIPSVGSPISPLDFDGDRRPDLAAGAALALGITVEGQYRPFGGIVLLRGGHDRLRGRARTLGPSDLGIPFAPPPNTAAARLGEIIGRAGSSNGRLAPLSDFDFAADYFY